jgi:hypothetical protein
VARPVPREICDSISFSESDVIFASKLTECHDDIYAAAMPPVAAVHQHAEFA